jgi:hypothetical protein
VPLKKMFQRLSTPIAEQDEERLREFCAAFPGVRPIGEIEPREEATIVGQIGSLRIVPHPDGSPWLEATVTDGTGTLVAMWTGRKRIAGIHEGQKLMITGRGTPSGRSGRLLIYNPRYELL